MLNILVTNDDGVFSEGVQTLAEILRSIGKVTIIAPDREQSATSQSLTITRPLRVRKIDDHIYTVDGTPTDCVAIGAVKVFRELPDLIVSGINHGGNLGDDIHYSGTVAAAREGTIMGVPSLAISVAGMSNFNFESAHEFVPRFVERLLFNGSPKNTLFNVNLPNIPRSEVAGVRYTRMGKRTYENSINEINDPWGRGHYWIGGGAPLWDGGHNTDYDAVRNNFISVTPLKLDMTDYQLLEGLLKGG